MPGTETQNYDLVMQFSEEAYRELLGALFDSDGFLCQILDRIGAEDLCGAFTLDVLFDRPADLPIPASALDLLDIRVGLGEMGSAGNLRIVAGISVDRTASDIDLMKIDFANRLFHARAEITGIPVPASVLENFLRDDIKAIPLFPVPVERGTTAPDRIRSLDARIIDDTSAEDRDASAALFTFGGGSEGNRNGFTRGLVPPGSRGAIAIFFHWLCRIIDPALERALELEAGSMSDCRLTRRVRIDEDEDVDLTQLELTLQDGFIGVLAKVEKSGFCYSASGTVSARIRVEVENGRLLVDSEVDDPDVDVDVPWLCWVAGAVIGALLGGILVGAIGALVGAVLVPLITWIATEVIEGIVEEVAGRVADAINEVSPSVDVPAIGINILFQDVFIDDITIAADVAFRDKVPIRSEGTLVLRNGQAVDLDSGRVGDRDLPGADLLWEGSGRFDRRLRTLCTAELARTGTRAFDRMSRFKLYAFTYASPEAIPLFELATIDPLGFITGDFYRETQRVYAARTNEGRHSAIRVVQVKDDAIRLQYRTYEKLLPSVTILGQFECEPGFAVPRDAQVVFDPTRRVGGETEESGGGQPGVEGGLGDLCRSLTRAHLSIAPRAAAEAAVFAEAPLERRRIGRWSARFPGRARDIGRFDAVTNGLHAPVEVEWRIQGEILESAEGDIEVRGVTFHYQVDGKRLVLQAQSSQTVELELAVRVTDARDVEVATSRCVTFRPHCHRVVRYLPEWKRFRAAYMEHFGVIEVPAVR